MLAKELMSLFKNVRGENTPLTEELHGVLKGSIQFYIIDIDEKFNKDPASYRILAEEINRKYYPKEWAESLWVIKPDYIMNLCFPDRNELTDELKPWNVSKWRISVIYKYLNDKYHLKGGRDNLGFKKNKEPKTQNKISYNIRGVDRIDDHFIEAISSDKEINPMEFYLEKLDYQLQWQGMVSDLDYPRELSSQIKNEIIRAFNTKAKVAAVINSPSGSGKSILLRRLALSCKGEDFSVLWVKNYQQFATEGIIDISQHNTDKFLLIIDDWTQMNANSAQLVLNQIAISNNIRVLIADRNSTGSNYRKFLLSENEFVLPNRENPIIVKEICHQIKEWKPVADELSPIAIENAPLYATIFIIANHAKGKGQEIATDIISQFKEIVEFDLMEIHNADSGVATALYYFACLYKEYKLELTWVAFLRIADYYNGNTSATKSFSKIDKNSTLGRTLLSYIAFESFLNPDLLDTKLIAFHHDFLVEEGITKVTPLLPGWQKYNEHTKFEFLEIFLEKKIFTSGDFMLAKMSLEIATNSFYGINETTRYCELVDNWHGNSLNYIALSSLRTLDWYIGELYNYSYKYEEHDDVRYLLYALIYIYGIQPKTLESILKRALDNGCKSVLLQEIYSHLLYKDDLSFITNRISSTWQELKIENDDEIQDENNNVRNVKFAELDNNQELLYAIWDKPKVP